MTLYDFVMQDIYIPAVTTEQMEDEWFWTAQETPGIKGVTIHHAAGANIPQDFKIEAKNTSTQYAIKDNKIKEFYSESVNSMRQG